MIFWTCSFFIRRTAISLIFEYGLGQIYDKLLLDFVQASYNTVPVKI